MCRTEWYKLLFFKYFMRNFFQSHKPILCKKFFLQFKEKSLSCGWKWTKFSAKLFHLLYWALWPNSNYKTHMKHSFWVLRINNHAFANLTAIILLNLSFLFVKTFCYTLSVFPQKDSLEYNSKLQYVFSNFQGKNHVILN